MPEASSRATQHRVRQRALGMRTTETMLHQSEIERLDRLKERLGLGSRSDAIRVALAKINLETLTSADAEALQAIAR